MNKPCYARFYKCDLHMHTPLDPNWRDESTQLRPNDPEDRRREVAREFLKACHEAGLEVIAITDHNFAPSADESFIKYLQKENEGVANEVGREPLVIFPGFEVEADVGMGCHVLCLFPPETPLSVVDSRLTELGLPPDKRFVKGTPKGSDKRLSDILEVIQQDSRYRGIVIVAHPMSTRGLFDNDRIAEWLQQEEFTNPDLLCLEIPKPIEQMSQGWQHLLRNDEKCIPEWKRQRSIACVMSSDCYRLRKDVNQPDDHHYIGYRCTWIKMSRPSIESLRQAFLDHDSRIRFGELSPDTLYTYPKIRRVKVYGGKFLRDLEDIYWSPNLNCLIGSRGTGKSTLVDYMRVALDRLREEDLPPSLRQEVEGRIKSDTEETESDKKFNAVVEIELETRGGVYKVVYEEKDGGKRQVFPPGATNPDPHIDVRTLFPCRILSQREIDHSVGRKDRKALCKFLDDFIRNELDDLERQEQSLKGKISEIEAALDARREALNGRVAIETERRDLKNQLESHKPVIDLLPRWQGVERERDFFERLFEECGNIVSLGRKLLEDLKLNSILLTEELRSGPNAGLIADAAQAAATALQELRKAIESAINTFEQSTCVDTSRLQAFYQKWQRSYEEIQQEFETKATGVNIGEIKEIPGRLLSLEAKLRDLDRVQDEVEQLERERQNALSNLRQVWRQQTEARQKKAEELMERLRLPSGKKSLVEIQVKHQSNRDEIVRLLASKIPDRRRLNEEDIHKLLDRLDCLGSASPADQHLTLMERFIGEARKGRESHILQEVLDRRQDTFLTVFNEKVLQELETERIPDDVMYYVYRQDGTLAGPIDKVSPGQQGTAILSLLLAAGDEPLIVDTPEEGLDNEWVYTELVPLFRQKKEKRQIILVTHNANLPVNADAEEIVALEAAGFVSDEVLKGIVKNSGQQLNPDQLSYLASLIRWSDWETRVQAYLAESLHWPADTVTQVLEQIGKERRAEGRIKLMSEPETGKKMLAVGALDVPVVKRAVQDIMEGSEEAFRRRYEKYGF